MVTPTRLNVTLCVYCIACLVYGHNYTDLSFCVPNSLQHISLSLQEIYYIWAQQFILSSCNCIYRGADKSSARPDRRNN